MSLLSRARLLVSANRAILANSGSLIATSVATAILGFGFWGLAARMLPADAVGAGSAAISATTLLGSLGTFGLGSLLIGELPKRRMRPAPLISAAMAVAGVFATALGVLFAVAGPVLSTGLRAALPAWWVAAVFVAGVALTAVGAVLDQSLVALQAGSLQLWRNLYFGAAKLVLLGAAALLPWAAGAPAIVAAWCAGIVLSLLLVLGHFRRRGYRVRTRPRLSALRGLGARSVAHNVIDHALIVPGLVLPLVVTVVISPAANARFFAAWLLASTLYLAAYHVSTSLFADASAEGVVLSAKLRFSLMICLAFGVPASVVLAVASPLAMRLFGSGYGTDGATCLTILALAFLPGVIKNHWVTVSRLQGRLRRAATVLSVIAVLEIAAFTLIAHHQRSIVAVAAGLAVSMTAQALFFGPAVYRATRPTPTGEPTVMAPGAKEPSNV